MPRILHIIDSLGHTGIANQMLLLARGLASHRYDVHVAVLNASPKNWATGSQDFPIINIGRRWAIDPLADLRLAQHVRNLQPDIVHTWNTVPGMFGPLAAQFARRRLGRWGRAATRLSSPRSSEPQGLPRLFAGFYCIDHLQSNWDAWWMRQFTSHAERIITNSNTVRDWCIKQKLPAAKLAVIPPGVPLIPQSDVSRSQLLQELRLPPDARLIGVVGRLIPEKRVQDLIWAADLLRVLHDNLRMLIIGDGPVRSQLEQYARMASDLDHIRFLGERDDVRRIMPHLDVLWNGSDNRSISIAMLEAMSAGVPIVASDVPVNRELVNHGETGYLIPVGRRSGRADRARYTDRIFSDTTQSARPGAASRHQATSMFNLDRLVQRHLELYGH
jgi:glycosyltransferase involved in cell wall biosynthesis